MESKNIRRSSLILISLLAVVLFANYWISQQVQDIQQEKQLVAEGQFLKEKRASYKPDSVKIDPENDPLAPMIKEKVSFKAKKMLSPSIGDEVYEVSESTEILVQ